MSEIIIKRSYIQERSNNLVRLNTEIIENGAPYTLYVEVEGEHGKWLTPELADNIAVLCLPVALRSGMDIISDIPISNQLLFNLNNIFIPTLVNGDKELKPVQVKAPGSDLVFDGKGVGTGLSCGVDSLYTVMEHTSGKEGIPPLTHFFVSSSSWDLWDTPDLDLVQWQSKHKNYFARSDAAAKELGLPLIKMYSNYIEYVCLKIHTIDHLTVHPYITMANVLAIKKLWSTYLYASTFPFNKFDLKDNSKKDAAYYELLTMHALTVPGFMALSSGAPVDRIEKTIALTEYPLAYKYLHPCFSQNVKNCSSPFCNKCIRALLTLHYYNKLDEFSNVFDVGRFHREFNEFMVQLVINRQNIYLSRLYTMYMEKYPELINNAYKIHSERIEYWERVKEYAYALSLKYLEFDNLDTYINKFVNAHNIHTVAFLGNSRLGNMINNIFEKFTKLSQYSPGEKADMLLLIDTEMPKLRSNQDKFASSSSEFKFVLSLADLHAKLVETVKE